MSDLVTIHHARRLGYCISGIRAHCGLVGVDFRRLVREGIPISEVEGIEDGIVQKIIKLAREDGNVSGN